MPAHPTPMQPPPTRRHPPAGQPPRRTRAPAAPPRRRSARPRYVAPGPRWRPTTSWRGFRVDVEDATAAGRETVDEATETLGGALQRTDGGVQRGDGEVELGHGFGDPPERLLGVFQVRARRRPQQLAELVTGVRDPAQVVGTAGEALERERDPRQRQRDIRPAARGADAGAGKGEEVGHQSKGNRAETSRGRVLTGQKNQGYGDQSGSRFWRKASRPSAASSVM